MQITRNDVAALLRNPLQQAWTVQGFGMLRTYINPSSVLGTTESYRLNIWHEFYRADGMTATMSDVHDHPWHFESEVLCGMLINQRYVQHKEGQLFHHKIIQPGQGHAARNNDVYQSDVRLLEIRPEIYKQGETYKQTKSEIHRSMYRNGTVTLNRRVREGRDLANVYWLAGTSWVSAEPRPATEKEVRWLCNLVLSLYDWS